MIRILALCAALVVAASSAPAFSQARGNSRLAEVIAVYEDYARRTGPLTSAREGDREALRRLPDASREAELTERAELAALRARVERVPTRGLNEEDALNRAYLLRVIDRIVSAVGRRVGPAVAEPAVPGGLHVVVGERRRRPSCRPRPRSARTSISHDP